MKKFLLFIAFSLCSYAQVKTLFNPSTGLPDLVNSSTTYVAPGTTTATATVLSTAAGSCVVNSNGSPISYNYSAASLTVTGGTDTSLFSIVCNDSGQLVIYCSATCSAGNYTSTYQGSTVQTGAIPSDATVIATDQITAGVLSTSVTSYSTPTPVGKMTCGTGLTGGNGQPCAVATTLISQKFFGSGAPGSVAGNLPGDTYQDQTNHYVYTCYAAAGTAAPACTTVATSAWQLSAYSDDGSTAFIPRNISVSGHILVPSSGYLGFITNSQGTITAGNLACITATNTSGNCSSTSPTNVIGVFFANDYYATQGTAPVNLDATVSVTDGDHICASTTGAGQAHDNGSTPCSTFNIGVATTTAASVSVATVNLDLAPASSGGASPTDLGALTYNASGTTTFAAASGAWAGATVTATHSTSTTFSPTGLVKWGNYTLEIIQDSTGGGVTFTLGTGGSCSAWKVTGGGGGAITLSSTASTIDLLSFTFDGTNCVAAFANNAS